MASIILTTRCNLHCPYCFASGFVNREKSDISITHFLQAVSFITRTESSVSLIGGEPTIHPGFQTIMDLLIANPRVNNVNLFTNNIFSDQYIPQMTHPKVTVIVNCNSPLDVGKEIYARFQQNLDLLFRHCSRTNQIEKYFDEKDNLTLCRKGYAMVHREYDSDKRIVCEKFFGTDGNPIELADGAACYRYTYNEAGEKSAPKKFDRNNHEIPEETPEPTANPDDAVGSLPHHTV
jgi:hypothetical protein